MQAIIEGYVYPSRPVNFEPDAPPAATGYNIAPTQQVNIVLAEAGAALATTARWWFVPHWFRDPPEEWKATTFNAKIETAREKPSFRDAWKRGRCLVPVMGYYEWTGPAGARQPHYIRPETNHEFILLAGLASRLPSGLRTCTILTRPALPEIADLHDRMPVILSAETAGPWLDASDDDETVIARYGSEWAGRMRAHPVHRFSTREDGPQLIEPLETLL